MSLERNILKFGYTTAVIFTKTNERKKVASIEPRKVEEKFGIRSDTKVSLSKKWMDKPYMYFERLGVYYGVMDNRGLKSCQETGIEAYDPQVPSFIRPVGGRLAMAAGNLTYGLDMLKVESLWSTGVNGKDVRVGHLDTGVDAKHPSLRGKLDGWIDTDQSGEIIRDSRPPEEAAYDETDNPPFSVSHGTHTAGTVAGGLFNGMAIGVAPGCRLYSAKVIEGGNAMTRVLTGLEWVIENGCKVLTMSLGFRGDDDTWDGIVESLRANGVFPCIAAGNERENSIRSPGSSPGSITVGAVDSNKRVADFSSSIIVQGENLPEIVAPGVNVQSAMNGGGLQGLDGTSMATPHVAGVVALLIQDNPSATVEQIEQALFKTCEKLPPPERSERYGFGLINPHEAMKHLKK
jgi:subtilisin